MPEVVDQRPVPANLTYRNVDAFSFWGKFTAGGFELPHGGIKVRCLTAWLRPNAFLRRLQFAAL
jgi:hypothetical protein